MLAKALLTRIGTRLGGLPVQACLWDGTVIAGGGTAVRLHVHHPRALAALARPRLGSLARAYVEGWLDLEGAARDILSIGQDLCRTEAAVDRRGSADWRWWRHTRRRDRRNIQYHYDVSNDFYGLWLDSRRVYSCAYFESAEDSLDAAQVKKLDLICRKLLLRPDERLLDIGCGWGALILHAAERHGVRALGVTLSEDQFRHVRGEILRRGLQDRVEVRLADYRDIPEDAPFDKIASVGMFEHVGRRHLAAYFGKIRHLLRPGGLVLNHGITSAALRSDGLGSGIAEFVEQYVFPGGDLVHVSTVMQAMAEAGLEPLDAENLRPHYAHTLWHWVERLEDRQAEAIRLIGEKRYRIWRIYMAGSAHAFERNWLSLFQVLAGHPRAGGGSDYPYNRRHVHAG